ncbi:MAG TPA: glycoside hydrolase family 2 TIM barrel-domain containing protein, partial [Candidatus Lokiarchaeia archaeon]|nr:glycoside hydrolase family 2 TIM barrel-domain containing protein [Candidatus Lokiarchaeia archaeon]
MINDFDKVGNIILSLGIRVRPVAYLYPDGRKFDLLDGEWLFQEDPINIGESEQWFKHEAKHLFRRTAKVPLPWQAQFPDLVNYTGTAWYARSFPVPQDAFITHAFLDFTAVDHETTAWMNGQFVGHHEGGYARFAFDIGQKLIRGEENYLVIRVFDPKNNQAIPHGKQGGNWYQQISGIWGSVFLEYLRDPLVVNDVVFKPRSVEGDVEIRVQVKRLEAGNVDKVLQLRCTVENGGDEQVLLEDARIIMPQQTLLRTFTFPAKISNPKLWFPGAPELYKANLILFEVPPNAQGEGTVVDSLSTEFGLRMVSTIRRQIRLNGRPVVLRGVLDQAFYPDTLYTPPSDDYMQEEIRAMKEMGVNLIRKHIKVEDPRYLYWCDHLGMLYWAEPPNFIIPTPKSFRLFEDTLTKMIVRDRNHPCVIIWGIFNEEWGIWGA